MDSILLPGQSCRRAAALLLAYLAAVVGLVALVVQGRITSLRLDRQAESRQARLEALVETVAKRTPRGSELAGAEAARTEQLAEGLRLRPRASPDLLLEDVVLCLDRSGVRAGY